MKGQNQQAVEGPWEEKTQSVFELRLKDKTLRQALIRWARQAKWVFTPEHWALEVDFPIKTAARFEGGFETAVAQLLDAAKLNAHPLQACFYSNRVLRVLSWPQTCKPQRRGEGQS
ncbi:toxin co-regulated pilus biosynthesis Q family protein [Alcaligenes ammonioxydans]|uniref:toxin co-regulated pilus biosynthesis Q family protein n=1 Tax=Alcaligenes ammonioxydans TaxID=2582914 RepID=UPI000683D821|nr:toxin co-regulated pilus biosynthesis Q family protein [Alcaligenes ammonioxydans]WGQ37262.1 toxin co-regulated pilus biosynthesis Q family protein [Alcaligenes faecalis]